jgi:toluene monooxygenase system protein E
MAPYPTYSALGPRTSRPSDYEIATTQLHYYVGRGFEVNVPVSDWYARYQQASAFRCDDWERFSDPRQVTYATYIQRSRALELELEQAAVRAAAAGDPGQLSQSWRAQLSAALGPLRYPLHGLHMLACYIGQMAPGGRITVVALFQAGDELRRIDHLAYRTAQLQELTPTFAADARERWERDAAWQPLREAIERLLVTYDWGEALIGVDVCLKPLLDDLIAGGFADAAQAAGDAQLHEILGSFGHDAAYQREWTRALLAVACEGEATREAVAAWIHRWLPMARRAVAALAPVLGLAPAQLPTLFARHAAWLASLACLRADQLTHAPGAPDAP